VTLRTKLHVPRVPARPGESPDFSYLKTSPAGAVSRPSIDVPAGEISSLARELVRVLDDDHVAKGEWTPDLDQSALLRGLRHMVTVRLFDERMQRSQRQGRITFYAASRGEEAVGVAQTMALEQDDMLFTAYRQLGAFIVRDQPMSQLMCQLASNTGDPCKGRQLPGMYHSASRHIFSISGNLATQFPQAVGWAMASGLKNESRIAAGWIGEGSTAEGDFHSALVFAAVYQAPVILNIVNNQWAISTFQGFAGGEQTTFASRALGHGIAGLRVDGNDFLATYAATRWAAQRARNGSGPTLIELVTYRASAHSTSDDPSRYRPENDAEHWPLGDPIERLKQHLITIGAWTEEQDRAQRAEIEAEVTAAWKEAERFGTLSAEPKLSPDGMFEDVFADMPAHLEKQRTQLRAELNDLQAHRHEER